MNSGGSSGGLGAYGAGSPIDSVPVGSIFKHGDSARRNQTSIRNQQSNLYMPHSKREIGTQTTNTSPANSKTGTEKTTSPITSPISGAASRFIRTFSVIGGTHGHHFMHRSSVDDMDSTNATPSRRKTLDKDVLQLIDSCRRYQADIYNILF